MVKTKIIESFMDFKSLEPAWNELVTKTDVDHTFMRFEWFDNWISSYQCENKLRILTIWRDGQLSAIAPLMIVSEKIKGIKIKSLQFLQSAISPRCNFIALDKDDLAILLNNIFQIKNWSILIADKIDCTSKTTFALKEILDNDSSFISFTQPSITSPYFSVDGEWSDYHDSLSPKRKRYLRQSCHNKINKADQHSIELVDPGSDPDEIFSIMLDISSHSWKDKANTSITKIPNQHNFYKGFTNFALPRDLINIWLLKINNEYAAFDYYLNCNRHYVYIRCDFKEEFSRYNPGENLRYEVIKHAFENENMSVYDFAGNPSSFKVNWAKNMREHAKIFVGNRSITGKSIIHVMKMYRRLSEKNK